MVLKKLCLLLAVTSTADAFSLKHNGVEKPLIVSEVDSRREFFGKAAVVAGLLASPLPSNASGGATAGKYTTIPIAKRRYYGRVQEAVHEFLLLGPAVVQGDMTNPDIQLFFDVEGVVVVPAKNQAINGQCTKKDQTCKGREIRDSRYNDMKASMYLLGNAFRINQQKAPDNLPTVKAAKAFFKEMDAMEKCVKKPKKKDNAAVGHYAAALDILDGYLDLVELPPIDSGHYEQEFSTLVGESSRIT
mmetsp:Transcript_14825/g.20932  ORF Transcript_14825/g.20932 Transcript_14825/m.20932 type:complete len:246 (+) Transcript_14825:98-835(+)